MYPHPYAVYIYQISPQMFSVVLTRFFGLFAVGCDGSVIGENSSTRLALGSQNLSACMIFCSYSIFCQDIIILESWVSFCGILYLILVVQFLTSLQVCIIKLVQMFELEESSRSSKQDV